MVRTRRMPNYEHDKSDKKAVIAAAQTANGQWFPLNRVADESLWGDRDVVLASVAAWGWNLNYTTPELKEDSAVVLAAVKNKGTVLGSCSAELKNNPQIVRAAVETSGAALEYVPDHFKDDKEIVLIAINSNNNQTRSSSSNTILGHASERLRRDREVVLAAIAQLGGRGLEHVAGELCADREIVLAAIHNYGQALEYAADELRADREIVLAAIQNYGQALKYASDELRADREVVLAAIQNCGGALMYASPDLKADKEIVLNAIEKSGTALYNASDKLKNDREVVMAALSTAAASACNYQKHSVLGAASEALRADRAIVLKAVTVHGYNLQHASPVLQADREIVATALRNSNNIVVSAILKHASKELRGDRELISTALSGGGLVLHLASRELQLDPDIVALAWETEGGDQEFDVWYDLENHDNELRKVYMEEAAALRKEMKKRNQLHKFDLDDPSATMQFADGWLSDSSKKKWLSGEITAIPLDLGGRVEAFAGVKEDILVATRLLRFSTILCYMKKGMEEHYDEVEPEGWDMFAAEAKGLADAGDESMSTCEYE